MNQRQYQNFRDATVKGRGNDNLPVIPARSLSMNDAYAVRKTEEVDNTYVNVVIDHEEPRYVHGITGATGPFFPQYYLTEEDPVNAEYNVTKTEPLIDKASDFYCSVIRFAIPLDQVPLLICPIVPNQTDPDLTPLIIGIEYGSGGAASIRFPINLIYLNQGIAIPPIQNQPMQVITPYYYMFSYQNLITMINVALGTAYVNAGLLTLFPTYLPPYFFLDPVTNLLSLIVPGFFVNLTSPATNIPTIFMNAPMSTYLDAFNVSFNGYNHIQGNDIYFLLNPVIKPRPEQYYYPNGTTIPTPGTPGTTGPTQPYYFRYTQEYSVLEYWTSLQKIIIATNMIPVRNEYLPGTDNTVIQNAQGDIFNVNTAGINVSFPILTDFIPTIDSSAGISRSIAYYVPTSQYRLIDLQSDTAIQKIDVKLYWQDRNGNLYPIPISIFQQASIKLGFFRKTLYKGAGNLLK